MCDDRQALLTLTPSRHQTSTETTSTRDLVIDSLRGPFSWYSEDWQ
jgi:hypothetical protein